MVGPEELQPIAIADIFHPLALVAVIAGTEVNQGDMVDIDRVLEHRDRQQGTGRGFRCILDMRELVDQGFAIFHRPELGGDRLSLNIGQSQPHTARSSFVPSQFFQEIGVALLGFPTALVNRDIVIPVLVGKLLSIRTDAPCCEAGQGDQPNIGQRFCP